MLCGRPELALQLFNYNYFALPADDKKLIQSLRRRRRHALGRLCYQPLRLFDTVSNCCELGLFVDQGFLMPKNLCHQARIVEPLLFFP